MTTEVEVVNRALQVIGTRTTITQAELTNQSSNEAIQASLILTKTRDELLRLAPWNCGVSTATLVYITSLPGTPENSSPATAQWQRGQPIPPWAYEYQYPVDCLRACFIIPSFQTGFAGIPIYPPGVVTGMGLSGFVGPPIRFKVQTDQFFPVTSATVAAGGTGHAIGDIITLASGAVGDPPVGAPAQLRVETILGSAVATVSVVNHILGASPPQGGSYFIKRPNPILQASSTGLGTGASFNLTYGPAGPQRAIFTNQESAALSYVKQVTDPNVMDGMFIEAWAHLLGSRLAKSLTGGKNTGQFALEVTNGLIVQARATDGNEGLTVNDHIPDWLRVRGINYADYVNALEFDWGPLFAIP